jgi:hypothetical protein
MEVFTLIATFGILNGLLGIFVLQKIYKDGASIFDRLSTALLICGAVALAGTTLSDFYLWRSGGHIPEALITIAITLRLCLRLRRDDQEYPIRYRSDRVPLEQ